MKKERARWKRMIFSLDLMNVLSLFTFVELLKVLWAAE